MTMETRDSAGLPWHDGELAVHRRLGLDEQIDPIARRNIRNFMPGQHRQFFAELPFLVVGSVDRAGQPWASLLTGMPGFTSSPDPTTLRIDAQPLEADPLAEALRVGNRIGLLGIELPTRRRNRMNGRIVATDTAGFAVAVEQSFGNCPQYIQRREYRELRQARSVTAEAVTSLDARAIDLIEHADTCFVASATPPPENGVDVSHRGGRPGFIHLAADGAIEIPDYRGNRFFNTLGNLVANPRAGLLFVDFALGDLLQLTGTTEIVWDGPEVQSFTDAERLWRLKPLGGNWLHGAFPLALDAPEFSPILLAQETRKEAG